MDTFDIFNYAVDYIYKEYSNKNSLLKLYMKDALIKGYVVNNVSANPYMGKSDEELYELYNYGVSIRKNGIKL